MVNKTVCLLETVKVLVCVKVRQDSSHDGNTIADNIEFLGSRIHMIKVTTATLSIQL